jgi:oxalate decarboxylase/phosphoglucose isomerase-like protein (cupin superfamily)
VEWASVISGRCTVTVIAPPGDAQISDLGSGDV